MKAQLILEDGTIFVGDGGWSAEERERVIDEVLIAYRFNTELFEDLSAAKAVA